MKITFFLGSGFAKSLAKIPIQDEFLPAVLKNGRRDWILNCLENDERKVIESIEDPEILLSYFFHRDTEDKKKNKKNRKYKKAIINFRMALNVFLDSWKEKNLQHKKFGDLIENLSKDRKYSLNFMTTNYDLILEKSLELIGKDYNYCLLDNSQQEYKLLKLHGSINWIEKREYSEKAKNLIGIDHNNFNDHVHENTKLFKLLKGESEIHIINKIKHYKFNKCIYTPITIPFFYQKDDWYSERWKSIFKNRIWKEAEEILKETEIIIFIGYGFPKADLPILSLFNKAKYWKKKIINIGSNCHKLNKVGIMPAFCSGCRLENLNVEDFMKRLKAV